MMFLWSAHLGSQTELGSGCIVGTMCSLTSHESLPDNTVVYGVHCARRLQLERPPVNVFSISVIGLNQSCWLVANK